MGDYKGQSIRRSVASLVAFLIGVCVCLHFVFKTKKHLLLFGLYRTDGSVLRGIGNGFRQGVLGS